MRPDPPGHRRRHAVRRAVGPEAVETLAGLIDDVEDVLIPHAQPIAQPREVPAADVGEPGRAEEGQAERGVAGVGQVHGRAHEVVGGREPGPPAVGVDAQ